MLNSKQVQVITTIANKSGYNFVYHCGVAYESADVRQTEAGFYGIDIQSVPKFDEDGNCLIGRFAVLFSGFGTLDAEKEAKVMENVNNAYRTCQMLNAVLEEEYA